MDTTIDIAGLIEKNKAEISRSLLDSFTKDVARSISWSMEAEIRKHAETYIQAHVLPEVQRQLETEKDILVKTLVASVKTGVDQLGVEIVKKITANLGSSWKVAEIAKKLIDG